MSIDSPRISLRDPVAHREFQPVHIIPLVYGDIVSSFDWYFIAPDGSFDLADWRTRLTVPGMLFANFVEATDGYSCQLYSTYSTGDPGFPISYAPQLLMGYISDPRTGKPWDPNVGFYSNVAI